MNYNQYVISFVPGTSGRFVGSVLDRMILQIEEPIELDEDTNNCHYDEKYTGVSIIDPHRTDVFDVFEFDPPHLKLNLKFSNILKTHVFPDFEVIQKKFKNLGVIVITFTDDDIVEIVCNSWYKNKGILVDDRTIQYFSHVLKIRQKSFSNIKIAPKNSLILNYADIYKNIEGKYLLVEKLKEFTGIQHVPNTVYDACERYIAGRNRLLAKFSLR